MNKTYRVVYNESTHTYTAVAEIATARGKSSSKAVVGSTSAQTTVRKFKGRMVAGWTLGAALLNFSMVFGFTLLPASQAVAVTCTLNSGTTGTSAHSESLACGINATTASIANAVAIGPYASATVSGGTAVGRSARTGSESVAVGYAANAANHYSVAIGREANSSGNGTQSVSLGYKSNAYGDQSIALGANAVSSGNSSVAIGGDDLDSVSKYNLDGTSSTTMNGGTVNTEFKKISGRDLVDTTPGRQYRATNSEGQGSVAVGVQAISSGHLSTAFGTGAEASGLASTALGVTAKAQGDGSFAGGPNASSQGKESIAFGADAQANGEDATAIGGSSRAAGNYTNALGTTSNASADYATAVGYGSVSNQVNANALGTNSQATGISATAVGTGAVASNVNANALGTNSQATGISSTAVGTGAVASNTYANAVGNLARAEGFSSTAVGKDAIAYTAGDLAIGKGAHARGYTTFTPTEIVRPTLANVRDGSYAPAMSIGSFANASGHNAIAIGNGASASGTTNAATVGDMIALGTNSIANADHALAFGVDAKASGSSSIAQGDTAVASGVNALAIGTGAQAIGLNSISIGTGNIVRGQGSGAIGDPTTITGAGSYSLGNDNNIATDNTFVIGSNVTKTLANSVALGADASMDESGSHTAGTGTVSSATVGSVTYGNFAAASANKVVSVGAVGAERRIQNVAAGAISATSTDAINGSQLYSTITNGNWGLKVGGTSVDADGVKWGDSVNFTSDGSITITPTSDGKNNTLQLSVPTTRLTQNANSMIFSTAADAGERFVKASDLADHLNSAGFRLSGGADGGTFVDTASDKKITTGEQFALTAKNNIKITQVDNGYAIETTGKDVAYANNKATVDTADTTSLATTKSVAEAINHSGFTLKTSAINGGTKVSGNEEVINPADTVEMVAGKNLTIQQDQSGKITYATKDDVSFNSVTIAEGPTLNANGINMNGDTITNLADGVQDGDAVNLKQLKAAQTKVAQGTNIASVSAQTDAATGATTYTVNAKGTTASSANEAYVTVKAGPADDNNVTDYSVDLSETAKESLAKADTAVQNFKTAVNGTEAQTVSDGQTVNFVNGTGTTARNAGNGDITFDVNTSGLTTSPTGTVTADNTGNNFATAQDVANAINEATKLTEKTTTVVAGSNTHVQAKESGNNTEYTVNADKATVSVSDALTMNPTETTDASEAVTTNYALDLSQTTKDDIKKGVDAKNAVDNQGLTFTGDSGQTNVEKLGSTVEVKGDSNITTAAAGDTITIKLNDNISVNSVTADTVNAGDVNATTVKAGENVLNGDTITINGTPVTNVNEAINKTAEQAFNPLTFSGDNTDQDFTRKLGEQVNLKGGADAAKLSDGNIGVVANGTDTLDVKLSKELKELTSAEFKDDAGNTTVVNGAGTTITPSNGGTPVSLTTTGLNNGGNQITNVASGGDVNTNAANIGDVKNAATKVTSADGSINVTPTTNGLQTTYDLSVPTTTLTTDKGNVAQPAAPNAYVTAGNLATTINSAVDSAKEKVVEGTNIVSVDSQVDEATGATTYTVNAKGTTASSANEAYVTVKAGPADDNNVTDYSVDLSETAKESLAKADTAVQNFKTAVNGTEAQTVSDGQTVNFVDGTGTTARNTGNGDITFDVNTSGLTTGTTGTVTADNPGNNFATAQDVANAINEATKLTEKTTSVVAGSNTRVQAKESGNNTEYTVSADKATVSVSDALTMNPTETTDANEAVTTNYALDLSQTTKDDIKKGVDAKNAVDNQGLTFTGDSGQTNVEKLGSTVEVKGDSNITTAAAGDTITIKLNDNISVNSVTATNMQADNLNVGPVTINNGGINAGNTVISNVSSGGTTETNAANIADVKNAATRVTSNDRTIKVTKIDPSGDDLFTTYDLSVDTSVPTSELTTNQGNVSAAEPDTYVKAGNLATTINSAVDSAKEKVVEGTNIVSVDSQVDEATGATTYTVNAKGTTASSANEAYVTVKAGPADDNNVTDYSVDLSETAKESLAKADTAVQNFKTAVNGTEAQTVSDGQTVNFVDGTGTTARNAGNGDITFDVNTSGLTTGTTGTVTADNPGNNFATAQDVANAINEATKLTEKTTTVVAGSNTRVQEKIDGNNTEYTVSADKATVSVSDALSMKETNATDDKEAVTTNYALDLSQTTKDDIKKGVDAKNAVDNQGLTFTGDSGQTNVEKLGSTVEVKGDSNITTAAAGDTITIKLNDNITVNSVTAQTVNAGDVNATTVKAGDSTLNSDGLTITNGPSITKNGIDAANKVINNVADGNVSADSKEAVNGSQLFTTNQNVEENKTNIANNAANIAKGINFGGTSGSNNYALGDTINVKGDANIISETVAGGAQLSLAKDITVDSVTADTVNAGDVNATTVKAGENVLNGDTITVNGTPVTNVNEAINKTAEQAFNPLTFSGDNTDQDFTRKLGEQVNLKGGADAAKLSDGNIGVVANGTDTLDVKLSKELKGLTSAEFKDDAGNTTVVNGAGTTITPSNGSNPVSLTTTGLNNGGNQITNVASGGDVNTNAANIGDVKKAKTEVAAGTNIVDVVETKGSDGQSIYTVNAKGTTASVAQGDQYLTVSEINKGENVTDYQFSLSQDAKDSLDKADTAVQTFTTSVNGENVETIGQGNTDVGFVNGNVTTARQTDGKDITFDVNFDDKTLKQDGDKLAANTTTLTTSETDGTVTAGNTDNLATAGDIANAINQAGFKLTATATEGEVADASEELVNAGETVTIDAGKNIKLTQAAGKITVATTENVAFNNVTVGGNVTAGDTVLNSDGLTINNGNTDNKPVSLTKNGLDNGGNKVTNVAAGDVSAASTDAINGSQLHDIIEKGFKITADQGVEDTVKLGDTVAYRSESGNIITKVSDNKIDFDLADKIVVGKNVANPVTVDGTTGTVTGLTNTTWDPNNITSGRAATEDQLKQISQVANAGWNLTAQGANGSNVAANESVDLNNTDNNIIVSKEADKDEVTFNLAKNITVDSVTAGDTVVNNDGVKNGDTSLTSDGITISNGNTDDQPVSLTKNGLDNGGNKITNVANGDVNAESKDAVNGSQLFNNAQSIANNLGAGSTVNPDGTVSAPSYIVTNPADSSNSTVNNVGDAVTKLNEAVNSPLTFAGDSGTEFDRKLGTTVNIKGGAAGNLTDNNIAVVADGADTLNIKLAEKVDLGNNGEVKAGNTTVNNDGVKVGDNVALNSDGLKVGDVSITTNGINAGDKVISNVADGQAPNDAVNVSQLEKAAAASKEVVESKDKSVTVNATQNTDTQATTFDLSVNTDDTTITKDADGKVKANTTKLENSDKGTVNTPEKPDALATAGDIADAINNAGFNVKSGGNKADGDEAEAELVKAGEEVELNAGKNLKVKRTGKVFTFETADDVAFNSVTTGDTVMNNDGVKVGDTTLTNAPITVNGNTVNNVNDAINQTAAQAFSPLTFAGDSGDNVERKLGTTLNVKGGASGNLTDNNIAVVADGNDTLNIKLAEKVDLGKEGEVKTGDTTVNNDGVKVGDKVALNSDGLKAGDVSVTDKGLDNGGNQIKNVAAGTEDTDGVNLSQLKAAQAAATTKVEGDQGVRVTSKVDEKDGSTTYTVAAKTDGVTTKVDEAGNIAAVTSDITADDKGVSTATTSTALATAGDVAEAINNSGFNVKSGGNKADGDEAEATLINPGEEVEFNAGKNLTVKRVGNVFTYATADDVDFNTVKATTVTTGDTTLNSDGLTINNGPSVTKTVIDAAGTQIINVKAGEKPTDAVNVSQLEKAQAAATTKVEGDQGVEVTPTDNADGSKTYTVKAKTDDKTIKIGDDGKLTAVTSPLTNHTATGVVDTPAAPDLLATVGDIANAINNSGFVATASGNTVGNTEDKLIKTGEKVTLDAGKNLTVTQTGGKFSFATADDVAFNSIDMSNGKAGQVGAITNLQSAVADKAPVVDAKAPTAAEQKAIAEAVKNAEGDSLGNAVNLGDLQAATNAAKTKVEGNKGVTVTSSTNDDGSTTYTVAAKTDGTTVKVDDGGNITANTSDLGNNTDGTVKAPTEPDALVTAQTVADAINNAGFNVKSGGNKADGDEAEAELVKAGEEVELNAGKNLKVKRTGKVFTFETADDVAFNSVTTGDTVMNSDGLTINNGTAGNPVKLTKDGLDNGGNQIKNVAAGTEETDGVNVSQLKAAQAAATTKVVEGDNMVVTSETNADGSTTYKVATAKDVNFDSVTTGDTVMNHDGVKNGDTSLTKDGIQVGDNTLTRAPIMVDGNTVNNVNDAINQTAAQAFSPLTFAGDSGDNVERKLGTTLNVKGGASGNLTDNNIAVVADGNDTLNIKLAEKVDLGKEGEVKTGDTTVNNDGVKVGDNVALNSDGLKAGDVSVTTNGLDNGGNQIKNVAAGTEDTDGVNVSQLKAAQAAATTKVIEGDNMVVTPETNADGSTTYTVATAKDVNFDSVTTGDTVMNNDGVKVGDKVELNSDGLKAGDVSVTDKGLDNGGNQIKNVAAGTEDTDGVNVSQLKAAQAAATTKVKGDQGVTVTSEKNPDDGSTTYTVAAKTDGTTVKVDDAGNIAANTTKLENNANGKVNTPAAPNALATAGDIANAINNAGFTAKANGDAGELINAGDEVNFKDGDNIKVTRSGSDFTIATAKDVTFDSVTAPTVQLGDNGPKITNNGGNVNVAGSNGAPTKITGLKAGEADTDAVNVSQLNKAAAAAKTEVKAGKNMTVTESKGSNGQAVYTVATQDDLAVTSVTAGNTKLDNNGVSIAAPTENNPQNTVSLSPIGLNNGGNTITNVAPGKNGTDAVNVNQLVGMGNQLQQNIDNVGKKAYAGVAGAIAQSSIPQVTRPGTTGLGIGGGYYGGESAMAIGMSSMSDGGNWIIKGNFSTNTGGHMGVGVGGLYQW